jgi:hypothetical protein
MNHPKGPILSLLSLILLILTIVPSFGKEIPKFTVVEVNPSALDVMVHAFDQVLLLVHNQSDATGLDPSLKEL